MIICGGVKFEEPVYHPLLESMPEALLIRGKARRPEKWVQNSAARNPHGNHAPDGYSGDSCRAGIARAEHGRHGMGQRGSRSARRPDHRADPSRCSIGKPERRWSVGALASEARMSRSVFAERFAKLAGMSPMQYVTHGECAWRTSGFVKSEWP